MPRAASSRLDRFATPPGAAAIVAAYGLLQIALQRLFSGVVTTDHAAALVAAEVLAPGYDVRQPPLFEWALYPVARLLGPDLASVLLVKWAFLAAAAAVTFAAAKRLLGSPCLALLAVLSHALLFTIGFRLLVWGTHTTALLFACGLTLLAWLRLLDRPGAKNALLLGLGLGAGLLSKYSFPTLPLGLFLATLADPGLRRRLRAGDLLLALGFALLLASPFLVWLAQTRPGAATDLQAVMREGSELSFAARAAIAPFKVIASALGYLLPLALIVALLFRPGRTAVRGAFGGEDEAVRLRRMTLAGALVATLLAALVAGATGATRIADRHMPPLVFALPILLVALAANAGAAPQRWHLFRKTIVASAVLVAVVRLAGFLMPEAPWCEARCRQMRPYEALRAPLADLGAADATLIGILEIDAGNLRRLFPRARAVWLVRHAPGPPRPDRPCLLVWTAERGTPADALQRLLPDAPAGLGPDLVVSGSWPHLWKPPGWRVSVWGVRSLPPESAPCTVRTV